MTPRPTWRSVVVLKGARTIIAAPDGTAAIAPFENPALATGGTGDVLAGAIGSLLAQGLDPFAAARLGVYLHGLAGDGVRERFGDAGLLASDLPDGLATARKRLVRPWPSAGPRASGSGSGRSCHPTSADARASPPMSEVATRRPIERRLSDAGLPPLPRTAWLEIDLEALADNLATLRELAGPGIPVRPVVKADAYGHGAVPVALALEGAGADGFCVAAVDEALELRGAGVRGPILVLYPVPAAWVGEAARLGIAVAGRRPAMRWPRPRARPRPCRPGRSLGVHLEVETGLGRGGLAGGDLVAAARLIADAPGLSLAGLWTHFQAVEDAEGTAAQVARFDAAAAEIAAAGIELPARHVAASAALLTDDTIAYDGVRPGLAVYGLVPDEIEGMPAIVPAARFRPVLSLVARPVRVADLPAGAGISYGPTFRTARPSRIATLPLGYGDGWSRALSNRAGALVRGRRVPLVGNVAMDAVMVDVTDVPGPPVDLADEFVLIGRSGRRADQRRGAGAAAHHELVGGRHRHVPPAAPGVPCRGGTGRSEDAHRTAGVRVLGAHRTVERRHLRPGGGRDRERRQSVAVDVDGCRRCAQARRRRRDRVRGRPPGARAPRRRDRDPRR